MPRHPLCALPRLIAGIEYSCSSTTPRLFACQSCCNVLFLEYLISRAVLLCRLKIRALRRALHRLHLQSLDATLAFSDCQGSGVLRQPNRGARLKGECITGKKAAKGLHPKKRPKLRRFLPRFGEIPLKTKGFTEKHEGFFWPFNKEFFPCVSPNKGASGRKKGRGQKNHALKNRI